ncbi:MAG TPA: amidohydrolase [Steroidobacteraceae bacterium]|jgi:predicted amidohydrolase YtcJ|nr:amidohydrolase [Steroidobacteraceae bacterium]
MNLATHWPRVVLTVLALVWASAAIGTAAAQSSRAADLILAHGTILTVDSRDTVAQAIAIRDGKVLKVGTDAAILTMAGPGTTVVDLHGRTATPGLIDSHAHIADGGVGEVTAIGLGDATSVTEIVERVRAKAARLKPGEWIQGQGWDEAKLSEQRYVLAADLDVAAPSNPVWLEHTTGHYGVANSQALRLGKVGADTANPRAGTIDRDRAGAPTGVLKESAQELVTRLIPAPTPEQWREGIRRMIGILHREGMTAFKDPDDTQPMWDAYRALLDAGELTVHVCVLWHAGASVASAQQALQTIETLPRPPQSLGDGRLLSCGAKIYMDGSGAARTAWMYKEWSRNWTGVDHGNYGYPAEDPAVYRQMVRLLHRAGINVGTHAVGERAIDWVVDTYAEVLRENPTRGLRHSIIHGNLPSEHAIEVMTMLQKRYDAGYPEMQPPFMWWIGDNYAGNLGPDRAQRLEPLRTLLSRGVQWTGGSDFFVTPVAARYGLWAAVQRETLKGTYGLHPFGTAEAVDVRAALRAYTAAAARQLFLEDRIGSLEPGKDADIAIWDRNPYSAPPAELKDMKCEMTLFHGRVVYESPSPQPGT